MLGISPPLEMIPDRFAPTLTIDQFFALIGRFGGYNELKQFGVSGVLAGQLVVAGLLGLLYGWSLSWHHAAETAAPSIAQVPARTRICSLGAVVGCSGSSRWRSSGRLSPTSFIGLPPSVAAPVTAFGLLAAYAVYGVVLALAYRQLVQLDRERHRSTASAAGERRPSRAAGDGLGRGAGAGVVARLARRLWDIASFAYDGTRFWGPLTPITPNDQFYVVTKNVVDPSVDREALAARDRRPVERPRTLRLRRDRGACRASSRRRR